MAFGGSALEPSPYSVYWEGFVLKSRTKRKLTEFLFLFPTLFAFIMVIIIPFILGIYYSYFIIIRVDVGL
mgnify:CR=1 FL=1